MLVFQVEQTVLALQPRLVDGGLCLAVVEDGYAQGRSHREVEVGLELVAPSLVAHRGGVGAEAAADADGGRFAGPGDVHVHLTALNGQQGTLDLGTFLQSLGVDEGQGGYLFQGLSVGVGGDGDVEVGCFRELEQLLQLEFVVLHQTLGGHHVVFVLCPLGGELCQVGLAHLAYFHHGLAALLVERAGFQALPAHGNGLVGVEDLHEELHDALLDVLGCDLAFHLCLLGCQFTQLDVVAVAVAVPHGPVGIQSVAAAVIDFVDARLHIPIGHGALSGGNKGPVDNVLAGVGCHGGQQGGLRLLHVLKGREVLHLVFLQADIVLLGIVDAVLQGPFLRGGLAEKGNGDCQHQTDTCGRHFLHVRID